MIDRFRDEYNFCSNFYRCPVTYKGTLYASSEHAYMSAKSDDPRWKAFCADGTNKPSLVKAKSYELGNSHRKDWDEIKYSVMVECLHSKFQNEELRQKLFETGSEYLVEGNTWGDVYWGVCDGVGENKLGKLLMVIRTELRTFTYAETWDLAERFADARMNGYKGTFRDWESVLNN